MGRRRHRADRRDISGVLLLDKPLGISSNAALQQVIRLFQARKGGHTGALDPLASGMLPICLGEATKLSSWLLDADKHYEVTAKLGIATATGDAEGEVIREMDVPEFDGQRLDAVLQRFRGDIMQVPPMYSALKRGGRPLYALAREGKVVEREARPVSIHRLVVTSIDATGFSLQVSCSKGTYIRTLVEDVAHAMGSCGHVTMLRRSHVDPYVEQRMYAPEELEATAVAGLDALDALLVPVDQALRHWPSVMLDASQSARIVHGQALDWPGAGDDSNCRIYSSAGKFIGLGQVSGGRLLPRRLMAQVRQERAQEQR